MVLIGIPTTSFPYVEETNESPISSTSRILVQHNIFLLELWYMCCP